MSGEQKTKKVSTLKRVLVPLGLLTTLFSGMFAIIFTIHRIRNYVHPYWFFLICLLIGFIAGFYLAKLLKPQMIINEKNRTNYFPVAFMFAIGVGGWFVFFGAIMNASISDSNCSYGTVVDAQHVRGKKNSNFYVLYVNVNERTESLLCDSPYWHRVSAGQIIPVCYYDSALGFDYYVLPDDI